MSLVLDIQQAELLPGWDYSPAIQSLVNDLMIQLAKTDEHVVALCFVGEEASAEMNSQYRQKAGPTNILSFPYEAMPGVETDLLGDLVVCAPIVISEANAQGKSVEQHMTHLLVHGILHLLGYDHLTEAQAMIMEQLEIDTLAKAGYPNPYIPIDP